MRTVQLKGQKFDGELFEAVADFVTVESPLQITLNGESFTVTMRTPGNDLELTRGLLFTEGIFSKSVMPEISFERYSDGDIAVVFSNAADHTLQKNKRSLISSSSCGICGKASIAELLPPGTRLTPSSFLDMNLLPYMFERMQSKQENFKQSGGSHAAAAFGAEGQLLNCYEDIGRHNAVDKVVGDLLLTNRIGKAECLLVSGRISYEIVSKAIRASIPYLIAVSAPSSLSVEIAEQAGMTLIAFCRNNRATVYTHPENIKVEQCV